MEIRLDEIADSVGGTLHGDPALICRGANPPGQSTADQITLIVDPQQLEQLHAAQALALITPQQIETCQFPQIVVADPHAAFAKIVSVFRPPIASALPGVGVDSSASIASSAKIHPTATICAGATIGQRTLIMPGVVILPGCKIGDDCVLHPGVTLYEYSELGDRVVLHAGTVIGANGFGYRQQSGRHRPTAQLGYVVIESDVEVGASVTIDRGTYGATRIGEGTKIDNQVMIAHNCQIGRHNLICSQVGIAGSCTTGDYVILAGQVGVKDHITLEDHTIVGAQAGVMDDCAGNQVYLGSPAMPQRDQMQIFAVQRRLPEMRRELKQLRKQLEALTEQLAEADSDQDQTETGRAA
ncbi:UDP-3-O-(3-hydroxymyristoyl)glucosamine N-acyltransferase [Stieleria sp. TO1_6]|uniref:UDP-3-O-(3-hydroxymyristoyl)glucosamine N-acyltransferase n=1 Tax=Stieleria tagensis TaxID=2956795 RepID=UPI00209B360B|nr:UDP-3-O-(3-hydroxymyristoyl)glucosamine N-acyltransferase [Stieleria tagensis]MCO8122036.1 UDP-3-O-(3-hydroxymyristoyl)glucosamine N-acyltransferase [Stieleria tagensis]